VQQRHRDHSTLQTLGALARRACSDDVDAACGFGDVRRARDAVAGGFIGSQHERSTSRVREVGEPDALLQPAYREEVFMDEVADAGR
jgi:hypothetical protein